MFGSEILEVAIGLALVFLIVSVICSAVREGLEAWLKTRAAYLERGIRELLHDRGGWGLASRLYQHPLIYGLFSGDYTPKARGAKPEVLANGRGLPSYIPSANFASALLDIAARGPDPSSGSGPDAPRLSADVIRANILNIGNEPVQRVLLSALDYACDDLDQARRYIEDWYDGGMDRVSGWYKRSTQWILFAIGLAVAVLLNVDSLEIADYLYRNDAARTAMLARAEAVAADTTFVAADYARAREALDSLELPIGWKTGLGELGWSDPPGPGRVRWEGWWDSLFSPLAGWILTALAATMGAPFWFDILGKMVTVRSTLKPKPSAPSAPAVDEAPGNGGRATRLLAALGATHVAPPAPPSTASPPPATAHPLEDGCDVAVTRATPDEDLPPAKGGVATT